MRIPDHLGLHEWLLFHDSQSCRARLVALFSPEHGFQGDRDRPSLSGAEAASGLPIHSRFAATPRPTPAMLDADRTAFTAYYPLPPRPFGRALS